MEFNLATYLFYFLAFIITFSAVMVITAKNPVHSVLFLIFTFFNAAGLFVLVGAEYLAMTLVIVYVGAVAVLFLFVVMMLDINFAEWRQGFTDYLPTGISISVLLFVLMGAILMASHISDIPTSGQTNPIPDAKQVTNTEALGRLIYTEYVYAFQLAGIILLIAMIGAIVLTHRQRSGVRKQVIAKQVSRKREDSVEVVTVKTGEGV